MWGSGYPSLMTETLAIVGAGRVGRALGRRLRELGWKIGAVVTRNESSARRAVRFIGAGTPLAAMSRRILQSTCILIATPDSAVASVAEELSRIGGEELKGHIILHTSGALDSTVLRAVRQQGAAVGSMHPLQTFSGVAVPPLEGKFFAIEGDAQAVRKARKIARAVGAAPSPIEAPNKPLYRDGPSTSSRVDNRNIFGLPRRIHSVSIRDVRDDFRGRIRTEHCSTVRPRRSDFRDFAGGREDESSTRKFDGSNRAESCELSLPPRHAVGPQ